ncbi:3-oxoacyl-[acyl-carrier-protein] reductase FabG [Ewingella americana]|uniref:3-oxoacyl-[acyl-carrier-protein] reductase FabG n=1 Tax=Ewingella americana TaxID=41202 RepID=A0A377N5Z3_9GAMM|nr:3-oxoacyl-[acyl-carrier-protein] reductase FabG [Ewingella americana]
MSNKIAIVTGASRGLGKNAVEKLADQGVDVILTYHSQREEADSIVRAVQAKGGKAAALQLDVGDSKSFTAFAAQVKTLLADIWQRDSFDFLVNNAGIGLGVPFAEVSEEQFDLLMNIHLKGPLFLTQKTAAADCRRWPHSQRLYWPNAFLSAGLFSVCGDERRDGSSHQVSGERAGRARHPRQYSGARGD